jgi:heme/copper-type cytochrome/quinol oxidase subunit 4
MSNGTSINLTINGGLWKKCVNQVIKGKVNFKNTTCIDTNTESNIPGLNSSFTLVKLFTIIGVVLLILGIVLVYKQFIKYKYIILIVLGLSFISNLIAIIIWLSKIQNEMGEDRKIGYSMILYIIGSLISIIGIILKEMKII